MPAATDDRVLIDFRTGDDAGVYRWEDGRALVQTVDFFTPIVDDPYTYGQIAAANALSDVYAMGGTPLTALAIAAFPGKALDPDVIREIFRGGFDKLREADVSLLGGHTIQDLEIKFGYAVTGAVDPDRVWSNAGARAGDVLVLTKPIGTGVITTAIKFSRCPEAAATAAIAVMTQLNRRAAECLRTAGADAVHGCTDVTGFGLLGHATQMAGASRVTIAIDVESVPVIDGAHALARRNQAGGGHTNQEYFGAAVEGAGTLSHESRALLFDPQTSGGLLVAVAAGEAGQVTAALARSGVSSARVGDVEAETGVRVRLR